MMIRATDSPAPYMNYRYVIATVRTATKGTYEGRLRVWCSGKYGQSVTASAYRT